MTPEDVAAVEAYLFASRAPVSESELSRAFPGVPYKAALERLGGDYADRGVMLARVGGGWCIRTRPEASDIARALADPPPRLSQAALGVLAIIAAFQGSDPVTRSDVERIRNTPSSGIFDSLFAAGLIAPGRRRETPGRPLTWVTTAHFLDAFDIDSVDAMEAVAAMRTQGLAVLPPRPGAGAGEDDGDSDDAA